MSLSNTITILSIIFAIILAYLLGSFIGASKTNHKWKKEMPSITKKSNIQSKSVLKGKWFEHLAPHLPGWRYSPSECIFVGMPVDYVVFKGRDEHNITEVGFVEVKSGKQTLSKAQKQIKAAIKNKKVFWDEYTK